MSVAIVTACMGREDQLLNSLKTWILLDVEAIYIVDYNKTPSLKQLIHSHDIIDHRIKVLHINCFDFPWVLTWAYNIGFSIATQDYILKLDCDDSIIPDSMQLFLHNSTRNRYIRNGFWAGDWRLEQIYKDATSSGVFLVKKDELRNIAGFNPCILTYGADDIDLYRRFEICGLTRQTMPPGLTHRYRHEKHLRHTQLNLTPQELDLLIKNGLRDLSCNFNMKLLASLGQSGYSNESFITMEQYSSYLRNGNFSNNYGISMLSRLVSAKLLCVDFISIISTFTLNDPYKLAICKRMVAASLYKKLQRMEMLRNVHDVSEICLVKNG